MVWMSLVSCMRSSWSHTDGNDLNQMAKKILIIYKGEICVENVVKLENIKIKYAFYLSHDFI